jgi:hypothetical protein
VHRSLSSSTLCYKPLCIYPIAMAFSQQYMYTLPPMLDRAQAQTVSGCIFHSLAQLHKYSTIVLQQADSLPTLESLGLLRWQGSSPPPQLQQLPQLGLLAFPWERNSFTEETWSHRTPLDASWDGVRACLDEVPIGAGGTFPRRLTR